MRDLHEFEWAHVSGAGNSPKPPKKHKNKGSKSKGSKSKGSKSKGSASKGSKSKGKSHRYC
jgi:hypothetical protein